MGKATKRSELTPLQRAGLEHLEACAREGVSIRAYARRRRLSDQKLYQLGKVLRRKGLLPPAPHGGRTPSPQRVRAVRKPRFVEVQARTTREPSDSASATWCARLPNGVVLEGSTDLVLVVEALAKL
jgi:hypothetical protein